MHLETIDTIIESAHLTLIFQTVYEVNTWLYIQPANQIIELDQMFACIVHHNMKRVVLHYNDKMISNNQVNKDLVSISITYVVHSKYTSRKNIGNEKNGVGMAK